MKPPKVRGGSHEDSCSSASRREARQSQLTALQRRVGPTLQKATRGMRPMAWQSVHHRPISANWALSHVPHMKIRQKARRTRQAVIWTESPNDLWGQGGLKGSGVRVQSLLVASLADFQGLPARSVNASGQNLREVRTFWRSLSSDLLEQALCYGSDSALDCWGVPAKIGLWQASLCKPGRPAGAGVGF